MSNSLFDKLCACACGCYIEVGPATIMCWHCQADRADGEPGHRLDRPEADRIRAATRPLLAPDGAPVTDPSIYERSDR